MRSNINLNHGDCMKAMAKMEDNQYDLAIVDPEYGINIANRNGSIGQRKGQRKITSYGKKSWNLKPPNKSYFKQLFRVSKNQIIWGGNYFTNHLPASRGWIVYDKLQPEGATFAMAELAYTSYDISVKIFRTKRSNMQNCVSNNPRKVTRAKIHPTQKPIELYTWLLTSYAKEGDKILDTHGGSMSIAIAAWDLKFDLDLWELDEDYYKARKERFENYIKQGQFDF